MIRGIQILSTKRCWRSCYRWALSWSPQHSSI